MVDLTFLSLPEELICHIFDYLDYPDFKSLRHVCQKFRRIVMDKHFKTKLRMAYLRSTWHYEGNNITVSTYSRRELKTLRDYLRNDEKNKEVFWVSMHNTTRNNIRDSSIIHFMELFPNIITLKLVGYNNISNKIFDILISHKRLRHISVYKSKSELGKTTMATMDNSLMHYRKEINRLVTFENDVMRCNMNLYYFG